MSAARIMVVDDDEDLRDTLCELLTDAEYEAVGAGNGSSALGLLRSGADKPDVILLDLMMPGMNGWEFREEQLKDPELASIRVVVMTASRDLHGISSDEVVYKPVKRDKLLEVVGRLSGDGSRPGSAPRSNGAPAAKASAAPSPPDSAASLIESQRQNLFGVFVQAPAPICVLRGPDLVHEMANELYFDLAGRRDVLDRPLVEVLPELGRQRVDEVRLNVIQRGHTVVHKEVHFQRARDTYWTVTHAPVQLPDGIPRVMCFCNDVTDEVAARRRVEQSEANFRRIVGQVQAGIAQTDLSGRFALGNERFREIVGRSEAELRQIRMQDITHPDDVAAFAARWETLVRDAAPFVMEQRCVKPDGSFVWIQNNVSRIDDAEGRPQSVAAVIIDITRRKYVEIGLQQSEERIRDLLKKEEDARREAETLYRVAESFTEAKLDLEMLVQRLTDHATDVVGAKFGAFFYNVINEAGEAYLLYTLSGAPREAFARLGLPRNTPIFEHTFAGKGVVRLDDVKRDPRYGRMAPHHGMPKGHLPVTSYLAVPVVSRTGEVIGGLFFGHPEPARFTEQHERMIVAVAANAAVAMDNARLYQAVRSSEARFRSIFETSETSIWDEDCSAVRPFVEALVREHGSGLREFLQTHLPVVQEAIRRIRIRDVNPATLRMFEASTKEQMLGSIGELFLPESYAVFLEELIALTDGKRTFAAETPLQTFRGKRIDVLLTLSVPATDTKLERVLVTLVDISARKLAEREREARLREAERALTFSDTFVGILGHDLRSPLSAIITASDLLLRRDPAERYARSLHRIHHSAERMARMIEQILDLTRARIGGGIPISAGPMDLQPFAHQLVEELDGASAHSIALRFEGDTCGEWDRDRLAQVISNLLGNAVEHGDPAQPIRLTLDGSAPDVVRITVWNGGAVPEHLLPTLFDPFRSATARHEASHKPRGLGLGLYIVQQIVHAHGGSIDVRSAPGEGTTFTISLPRKVPSAARG